MLLNGPGGFPTTKSHAMLSVPFCPCPALSHLYVKLRPPAEETGAVSPSLGSAGDKERRARRSRGERLANCPPAGGAAVTALSCTNMLYRPDALNDTVWLSTRVVAFAKQDFGIGVCQAQSGASLYTHGCSVPYTPSFGVLVDSCNPC
jgi:hypothetical protein